MTDPRHLRAGALLAALFAAFALAACGSGDDGGGKSVKVSLVDSGCSPETIKLTSGPVTFDITNEGTSNVSEMEVKDTDGVILGEAENVVEGVPGKFSLSLDPGKYVVSCPSGDAEDQGTITVTGKPVASTAGASPAVLAKATDGYRAYVIAQTAKLRAGVRQIEQAIDDGDVAKAKELFGPVRRYYETVEPVAESFGELDPDIDARINDVVNPQQWTGFHRIEKTLYQDDTTANLKPFAHLLVLDVGLLAKRADHLRLQPAQLANGAVELLNEVANSKITGEEDRYSHTDLSDFAGNLEGARAAFELLVPALEETGNDDLVQTINERFAVVEKRLDKYKRDTALGYALYDELTPADKMKFAQDVDSLAEPLSTVAITVIDGRPA